VIVRALMRSLDAYKVMFCDSNVKTQSPVVIPLDLAITLCEPVIRIQKALTAAAQADTFIFQIFQGRKRFACYHHNDY